MNLKKFKKLSGDASFRQFYRTNNSVLVYSKIQKHVGQYQNMTLASNVENCFVERPPEIEHD